MFNRSYVGGLVTEGQYIFVVANGAINKFPSSVSTDASAEVYQTSFATNTVSALNGIDVIEGKLIYTTENNEIKSNSKEGAEIFCYKNPNIERPQGLTVLRSGLFLVLDINQKGKIHLLSADERRHKPLLDKFKNVSKPRDIWLDTNKRTFYVCGGEFIDIYKIV